MTTTSGGGDGGGLKSLISAVRQLATALVISLCECISSAKVGSPGFDIAKLLSIQIVSHQIIKQERELRTNLKIDCYREAVSEGRFVQDSRSVVSWPL